MSETFEEAWARCSPWLQAALDEGPFTHTLDDVKAAVERREARFWAGRKAAMVTEILHYPQARALHFWLGGGDLEELKNELAPMAESYGREQGCAWASIAGRKGWARALGYAPLYHVCAKELRT